MVYVSPFFYLLEEGISDVRDNIRVQDFLLMLSNLLLQGHAFAQLSHLLFDHAYVFMCAALDSVLLYAYISSAVARSHMLNEI